MHIDHSSMEGSGRAIHTEGGEFDRSVNRLREQLEPLIPYFGNPETDEAARTFRRGADGRPGFDAAYQDLGTAVRNLGEAYRQIGTAIVAMSRNVDAVNWASMDDTNAFIRDLIRFAESEDGQVGVPTTPVERT